jgi:hypothetical protein
MRCTRLLRVSNWRIIPGTRTLAATERWPLGAYAVPEGVNLSMTATQHNWDKFALLLIDVQRDFWSE